MVKDIMPRIKKNMFERLNKVRVKVTKVSFFNEKKFPDGAIVHVAGIFNFDKIYRNKKGELIGFGSIEDHTGSIEVFIMSDTFNQANRFFKDNKLVIIEANFHKTAYFIDLLLKKIVPLDSADKIIPC